MLKRSFLLSVLLSVLGAHIFLNNGNAYSQQVDSEMKLLVKIVSRASQLAGAASACEDLETGSKATHIRDSAIAAGLDHGIINMQEEKLLKSLSAKVFFEVRAKFLEETPFPCSNLGEPLLQLENMVIQN